jgi:protein-L-isoaspartate(D-aspartate) O-methyltransferase
MTTKQIATRNERDDAILDAMRKVPRKAFVPKSMAVFAHLDRPLPIGHGHSISQSSFVAGVAEALRLEPTDRVLDIGTVSGYEAAVLSRIAGEVFAVQRLGDLAREARERFEALGYDNIHIRHGDAVSGWPEAAPFDAIAAPPGPEVSKTLRIQLAIGGRLAMPVESENGTSCLLRVTRIDKNRFKEDQLDTPAAAGDDPVGA